METAKASLMQKLSAEKALSDALRRSFWMH